MRSNFVETQQPHAEERATRASRSMGSKRPTDLSSSVLGLTQAQADRRGGPAFGAVRSATAWTEHRDQGLGRFAAYRAVGLDRSRGDRRCIALIAFFTGCALGPLRTLRASLSLGAGHTLNALRALWTGRALCARLTLRPRIPAAGAQRKRNANDKY